MYRLRNLRMAIRWRYGLRTLAVLTLGVSLAAAWVARAKAAYHRETMAANTLVSRYDAIVQTEADSDGYTATSPCFDIREIVKGRLHRPVSSIFISDAALDSLAWQSIQSCTYLVSLKIQRCRMENNRNTFEMLESLQSLDIRDCAVSEKDYREIFKLRRLESLTLAARDGYPCRLGDQPFSLTNLRSLHLEKAYISTAALRSVERWRTLSSLTIVDCQIESALGRHIAHLSDLNTLTIIGTTFDDRDIASIQHLNKLEAVTFNRCDVTDRGAILIAKHCRIYSLSLAKTSITDEAVRQIAFLPRIRFLDISNTNTTQNSLSHLKNVKTLDWAHVRLHSR